MIATFKKITTIWHDSDFHTYPAGREIRVAYSGTWCTLHFEDGTSPLRVSVDAAVDMLDITSVPTYSELGLSTDPAVQEVVSAFSTGVSPGRDKPISEVEYGGHIYGDTTHE